MNSRVQCGVTAGIALVGASVIAIAPIAPSTAVSARAVDAAATLMASFEGKTPDALAIMSAQRLLEQLVQAPLIPLVLAMQLAGGDEERLYSSIRQIVDSPVYVADPAIEAIANLLPASLGGGSDHETTTSAGDGPFMQFRNNDLLGFRDSVNGLVADVLGVNPTSLNENYAAVLTTAFQASALRVVNAGVLGAVGIVPVMQAIAAGDNGELYKAIREYTDAPLWAADPAIEGLANALPASLGGDTNNDPDDENTGGLMQFRDNTLWTATRDTRVNIAHVLNVDVNTNGDVEGHAVTDTLVLRTSAQTDEKSDAPDVDKLKPHFTNLNTHFKQAGERAEARRTKAKANMNDALKKVQTAVENTVGKLSPKKKANAEKPEKKTASEDQSKGSDD